MSNVNFTSALYLGFHHESESLRWKQLTTGTPAALGRPPAAARAAAAFAALVGCERAVALASTLHAFTDLFGDLWRPPSAILHDEAVYPIARWAMERAERRGARVRAFRHLDAGALERALRAADRPGPWIVTDGFCAGCARPAPLDAYAALARRFGARLIVDDAQSVGLHGPGGGGSLRGFGLPSRPDGGLDVVVVASLAKAFGAPLAMVAGSAAFAAELEARGETLVHCSPPAAPVLAAAERALALNASQGEARRALLAARVRHLRQALRERGFAPRGGRHPMQRVPVRDARTALALRDGLARLGVAAVVRRSRCNDEVSLTFIVTARHGEDELRRAADALAVVTNGSSVFQSNLEA